MPDKNRLSSSKINSLIVKTRQIIESDWDKVVSNIKTTNINENTIIENRDIKTNELVDLFVQQSSSDEIIQKLSKIYDSFVLLNEIQKLTHSNGDK